MSFICINLTLIYNIDIIILFSKSWISEAWRNHSNITQLVSDKAEILKAQIKNSCSFQQTTSHATMKGANNYRYFMLFYQMASPGMLQKTEKQS